MFTYIKPEFMIHAFCGQRDTTLMDRDICVARLGDLAIQMAKVDEDSFSLSVENVNDGSQYSGRIFNIKKFSEEDIIPVVEQLFKRMQIINDQEVFDKREHIWKWYALEWLQQQDISLEDYIDSRMTHVGYDDGPHWKSLEDYLSSDYLNVASTLQLIEKYADSEESKKALEEFVAKDVMELRQRYSLESMKATFEAHDLMMRDRKAFSFAVEIEAADRDEAREKLQKIIGDNKEIFIKG